MKDAQKPDRISLIGRHILERKVRCRLDPKANGIWLRRKRIPPARASMVYLTMSATIMTGVLPALPAIARSTPWYVFSNVEFNPCVRTDKIVGLPNFADLGPLEFAARMPGAGTYSNSSGSIVFVDLRRTSVSGHQVDDLKIIGYFRDLELCDKTSFLLRFSQNLKADPSSWLDETLPDVVSNPNKIPETVRTLLGSSGPMLPTERRR